MTRKAELGICVVAVLAVMILVLALTACAGQSATPTTKKVDYPTKTITFIAPSKPGSGFDTTARAVSAVLEKEKLVPVSVPVQNFSSAVEGIANIVQEHKNDPDMISVNSIALLINTSMGRTPYGYKDFTLIANLISSYYGWVVRADAPYQNVLELLKDLKEKPEQTPICGGSDDDVIASGASIATYGADLKKIKYAAYAGGTESSMPLLEGSCKAQMTTVDDIIGLIESKKVRVLAVSGATRLGGVFADVPTFKEAGHDLEWTNFRYIAGGPNMPDYAVQYWRDTLTKMVKTPTWKEMVERYRWGENFIIDGLDKYVADRQAMVDRVVAELGLKPK